MQHIFFKEKTIGKNSSVPGEQCLFISITLCHFDKKELELHQIHSLWEKFVPNVLISCPLCVWTVDCVLSIKTYEHTVCIWICMCVFCMFFNK